MRKYVLSLFLLLMAVGAMAQKKSVVNLIRSKSSTGIKLNGKDIIKVYDGTFKQDYSTLSSDSAYFYPQDNAFDAFGHVWINQGDTLNIYSDKLNYNGNTKVAILTDNVKMIDKDATLTTNHLTYNTATRIGTYTDGGKLVNKDNTLLSKNGYYFAFTRDSYFRYNVSLTTPDALVLTDTMRYNTGTRISYFYGPTNIYGTQGKKDRDTLYTENGTYNTVVEQAAFGKNNLYRSGTKSLKGDSLFYDKLKGYGRAVKHVTFNDKEQKVTIKGDLGTYFKEGEKTIITQDPLVILVTENKDTTKTDTAAKTDSLVKKSPAKSQGALTMAGVIKNTIPSSGKVDPKALNKVNLHGQADSVAKKLPPGVLNTIPARIDTVSINKLVKPDQADSMLKKLQSQIKLTPGLLKNAPPGIDSATITKMVKSGQADSLLKQFTVTNKATTKKPKPAKKPAAPTKADKMGLADKAVKDTSLAIARKDTTKMKTDSIYMSGDTIETQILTYKDLKIYQEKQRLAHVRDTTSKPKPKPKPKTPEKLTKLLTASYTKVIVYDTAMRRPEYPLGKPKLIPKRVAPPKSKKQLAQDSLRKKKFDDSVAIAKKLEPADTARIRIIIAHHHFKMFKSDLQAKSDSMFYSNVDSTIRCFVNPIMWTEGSQLSGDTILLQMKHRKLDNMRMFPSAFIVNTEKGDTVHFNQIGGKLMRGYFKNDKLYRMFIEGNAESIYFSRDSAKNTVDGMERSLSSRIRVDFKNSKATAISFYVKPAHNYGPLAKFKEDDKILKGFIWKPKERPVSKESIIPSYGKKAEAAAKGAQDKLNKGKPTRKLPGKKTTGKDSLKTAPSGKILIKAAKDSVQLVPPGKTPLKTSADSSKTAPSVKVPLKTGKDSTLKTVPPTPAIKTVKDTAATKGKPPM